MIAAKQNGAGKVIDKVSDVGGYPTYKNGLAPTDGDVTGCLVTEKLRTVWCRRDDSSRGSDGNGFTNLEDYPNSIVPISHVKKGNE